MDCMVVSLEQLPVLIRGTISSVHRDFQTALMAPDEMFECSNASAQVQSDIHPTLYVF